MSIVRSFLIILDGQDGICLKTVFSWTHIFKRMRGIDVF